MLIKYFMTKKFFYFALTALMSLGMASCNSDDVILPDEPQGPEAPSSGGFRPVTAASKASANRVYEWTPAPGQFINDNGWGIDWTKVDATEAAKLAYERLEKKYTVSLGSFGGYITVGFDHSIMNTGSYEIGVLGNAFISAAGNSNEPGIVYVMQDTNGNGLPDDTWYELRGSDTFAKGTILDYAVTYYRPDGKGQDVRWTDNLGNEGEVKYMSAYHNQDTYYPGWMPSEYTLTGTRLEARTQRNPETGNWDNPPFEWGYADNLGSDNQPYDGFNNCNRFRISDAIDKNGNAVSLEYIDFVKVQTGVNSTAGWLGELSTEVFGIVDLNFTK